MPATSRSGAERDLAAARRDAEADGRDDEADLRDGQADARERSADRDRRQNASASDRLEGSAPTAAGAARRDAAGDRRRSAADRRSAREDRSYSASERSSAARDDLTGTLRRGVGMVEMQREIDRCRRSGDPLVVAFLDVDGLKMINDKRGHQAGDRALRAVGVALRNAMRSYDVVMRYGGDEFLCAQPGVGLAEVNERVLALRVELASAVVPVSVSFGLAELRPGDHLETLVARADDAVYKQRRRARGRASDTSRVPS